MKKFKKLFLIFLFLCTLIIAGCDSEIKRFQTLEKKFPNHKIAIIKNDTYLLLDPNLNLFKAYFVFGNVSFNLHNIDWIND